MLIKESEVQKFVQPTCTVLEYGGSDEMDIAVAMINGRYPETGEARNTKSVMMYLVLSGKGTVMIEGQKYKIKKGDVVSFGKGKWYWTEGNFSAVIASSPRWSPNQYEHRD